MRRQHSERIAVIERQIIVVEEAGRSSDQPQHGVNVSGKVAAIFDASNIAADRLSCGVSESHVLCSEPTFFFSLCAPFRLFSVAVRHPISNRQSSRTELSPKAVRCAIAAGVPPWKVGKAGYAKACTAGSDYDEDDPESDHYDDNDDEDDDAH
jgi:hypothetical protein